MFVYLCTMYIFLIHTMENLRIQMPLLVSSLNSSENNSAMKQKFFADGYFLVEHFLIWIKMVMVSSAAIEEFRLH